MYFKLETCKLLSQRGLVSDYWWVGNGYGDAKMWDIGTKEDFGDAVFNVEIDKFPAYSPTDIFNRENSIKLFPGVIDEVKKWHYWQYQSHHLLDILMNDGFGAMEAELVKLLEEV